MLGDELLGHEAEPGHHRGPEVLDQHVGGGHELAQDGEVVGVVEVERDRPLPPVRVHEVGRGAAAARAHVAEDVAARRPLHLDHVGALLGQDHRGERPRQVHREVDDADSGEGSCGQLRSSPDPMRHVLCAVDREIDRRRRARGRHTVAIIDEDAAIETIHAGRHARALARERRRAQRARARARRRVPARDGRADARVRALRRDHPRGVRRSRPRRQRLRAHRRGDRARVDVADRRGQHPPDGGGARPPLRHRRSARAVPPATRGRRAARRARAHRARLRHRPAGRAHHRDAGRRRLRAAGHEDVDHERARGQLPRRARQDRRRRRAAPPRACRCSSCPRRWATR